MVGATGNLHQWGAGSDIVGPEIRQCGWEKGGMRVQEGPMSQKVQAR